MAWTTPRTWTTGELVTAAIMNAHIRDNQNTLNPAGVSFFIDEGGAVLTTGSKIPWSVPFGCTISQWDLFCDGPSNLAIEIYANSYGGALPTVADSINSGSPAFCASSASGQDTSPSAWSALTKGDQVLVVVSSANGITKGTLTIYLART